MKYSYPNPNDLALVKSNLLEVDEWSEDKPRLLRSYQGKDTVNVNINTKLDAIVLLDYLSTDKSSWDFEPKLNINMFGTEIKFQRRGNYGHLNALEDGDSIIVDKYVREMIDTHFKLKAEVVALKKQLAGHSTTTDTAYVKYMNDNDL